MSTSRRPGVALMLALLVLLAGCGGGVTSDSGTATPNESPAGDSSGDAASTHPLASQPVSASHTESLRAAESFTLDASMQLSQTTPNGSQSFGFDWTVKADLATGAQILHADLAQGDVTGTDTNSSMNIDVYVAPDGTAVQRASYGGNVQYQQVSADEYNLSTYVTAMDATSDLDPESANFTYEGTTTVDGETLYVYSVSNLEQLYFPAETGTEFSYDSVETFNLRLLVDEDGVIRQMQYDLKVTEGESVMNMHFEMNYSDIGSTTVEEPDWVSEAESGGSDY